MGSGLNFEKLRDMLPKTYTCTCNKTHSFSLWAYAHWDIPISSECSCGRVNHLLRGKVFHTDEPTVTSPTEGDPR